MTRSSSFVALFRGESTQRLRHHPKHLAIKFDLDIHRYGEWLSHRWVADHHQSRLLLRGDWRNSTTVNCTSQAPGTGVGALIGTCVSIRYAYPWKFGQAAILFGRSTALPSISAVGVALNEN